MPVSEAKSLGVLVVDDSATARAAIARGLEREGLRVLGGAADARSALALVRQLKPDVLTLDLEMPHWHGLEFLTELMRAHPMPVVVLSALAGDRRGLALQAMELGAVEVLDKGQAHGLTQRLALALRRAALTRPRPAAGHLPPQAARPLDLDRVVAIGASTGGTGALHQLLPSLPAEHPPILIVQHMPAGFTALFARRLDQRSALLVREAADGDVLERGVALVAPGGLHMRLERWGQRLRVRCVDGPAVHHVRPSADVLFHSVAEAAGPRSVGMLLTGMGSDGAEGLLRMRRAGARTLVQDEASSVVWGMPGSAVRLGAAEEALPLADLPQALLRRLGQPVAA
ncbi:MAG TPA: chemotaxis-specific protein-glutamate methyltransferase CheB [bacterium]|jgi:two-component system chemotaxis response regulator CheB|nr:chemotaxis-specific protein-glutamate methyltransferase CheB [bacterium]